MAIPTIAPSPPPYPPIRYSPIQEAFRGALDVGLSELFRLPFEQAASRRATKQALAIHQGEIEQETAAIVPRALASQQSDIQTHAVTPEHEIDPTTRSFFPFADVAEKFSAGGEKYYTPESIGHARSYAHPVMKNMQDLIDAAKKRFNAPDVGTPILQGELPRIAEQLGLQREAAEYERNIQQFEELRTDDLLKQLQTPPPGFEDFVQHWAFKDPQTGQIGRNISNMFYAINVPRYISALQNPALQRDPAAKSMIEGFLKTGQEWQSRLVQSTTYFPQREEIARDLSDELKAPAAESMSGAVGRHARTAAALRMLKDPTTGDLILPGGSMDMVKAITALQRDPQLLEAMIYWEAYGSMDKLQNARNNGLGAVPTNNQTWKYLQSAFGHSGNQDIWSQLPDSNLRQRMDTGTGPAAADTQPPTATTPGKTSLAPAGSSTVLAGTGAATAVPGIQFVGTNAERAIYNHVFTRMKTDPTSFRAMSDSLEGAFHGAPSDIANYFRRLASDMTANMSPSDRTALTNGIAAIEALPPAQQARWWEELKWKGRSLALLAREDALSAGAQPAGEPKKEEKPAEPKKKE